MALILSIDTSLELAAVALSQNKQMLGQRTNGSQTDHAAWIHLAISYLLKETGKTTADLSAIAVSSGPGSYTGLRVGMAAAKGLCFALNIPLITESTLRLTAFRVTKETGNRAYGSPVLIAPMIDARRMEVFTALYDLELNEKSSPAAVILDESAFHSELQDNIVLFCGNGSAKWNELCHHPNAVFLRAIHNISDLVCIATDKFERTEFSDLAYTEPDYVKNVYTGKKTI